MRRIAAIVRAHGPCGDDRVALLVENGPEAFSPSRPQSCAPLDPSYRSAELEFYLSDLRATALVVGDTLDTPAREVARALGIGILDFHVEHAEPAGVFTLDGAADLVAVRPSSPDVDAPRPRPAHVRDDRAPEDRPCSATASWPRRRTTSLRCYASSTTIAAPM